MKLERQTAWLGVDGVPLRGDLTISCDKVLASPFAEIAGIPVALIGLAGFGLLFLLAAGRLVLSH